MGRARGAKPRKPKVADMPFAWTDALINEVQESTNSTGALLDKYASDPPSPGKVAKRAAVGAAHRRRAQEPEAPHGRGEAISCRESDESSRGGSVRRCVVVAA